MSTGFAGPARFCRSCGTRLGSGATFCRSCGARVGAAPTASAEAPTEQMPASAPGRAPDRPAAQAPAGDGKQRTRMGRAVTLAALAGLLVGGGVAAGIVLLGGDDGTEPARVAPGTAATVPTGEEVPTESGEADSPAAAAGFPTTDRAQMAQEIQATLLAFHEDVVAERFRDAWSLLSARKRAQTLREDGYGKWVTAQESLVPYLSPAGLTVRVDELEDDGVARVLATGMGWSNPGSPCSEWSGLTWAKYEGGTWTYDPGYSTTGERERTWEPRYDELLGANC